MKKASTIKAKSFLNSVDIEYINSVINNINFSLREKKIIQGILDGKSTKELSIELNLSLSYITSIKDEIYSKISRFLE